MKTADVLHRSDSLIKKSLNKITYIQTAAF